MPSFLFDLFVGLFVAFSFLIFIIAANEAKWRFACKFYTGLPSAPVCRIDAE